MKNITVYTTNSCRYCVMLKNFLMEQNIPFNEVNLETNPALMEDLVRKTGQYGVPQTEINGQWVLGFDPNSIINLLNK
ncbi:glutaredoxin family protein [Alkalihalobacterium chitinilyticum]|uniref:Glutaredoxin family protein n=1 Tax=Alkalihalobacterium chitinilyticum TaxID=2980103 RepID=A0ABT5VDH4_9BACI|nr:glutaredoxin domain-containing protein [Alkalihalobacterium chitinilyticum]MDE5413493.1 glutaredoxin family protein [Alkalihalobacterium chitinilyticum]